ncbi:MAG: hypothetical protein JNJ60_14905 [Rhodocyclaceae bacterium]|nr:hypothetical protein [Rhodocyclaceae bacterium]
MANDSPFAIEEPGVCLELATPSTPANGARPPRVLRLVKYAALCPIGSAQLLLDKGEPDFPRRIVGRCTESPREHVFSFDRATHSGDRLRGPRKNSGRT